MVCDPGTRPQARLRGPLLRVPPFPGSRATIFSRAAADARNPGDAETTEAIELIHHSRVGGTYWGAQPALPASTYTLVRVRDRDSREAALGDAATGDCILCWLDSARDGRSIGEAIHRVIGTCDPWHLLTGASAVVVDADDELALLGAIAGVPVR